ALPEGTRFLILAPVVRGQKGEYKDLFEDMLKRGFVRARADGRVVRLTDDLKLDRRIKHHIEIVIDRLKVDPKIRPRLAEAVDQALVLGEGNLIVAVERETDERRTDEVVARSPDRATAPDRRSPEARGDLRSEDVARSGDRATTAGEKGGDEYEDILLSAH